MNLYLNELAPWERKYEYYNNIQIGKDVKSQTEAISNASRRMVAAQLASADAIIASQQYSTEVISGEIRELGVGIKEVSEGIAGLKSAFEFGISEVVWQIEQNRAVLQSILEVLSAPLDTQAKELRKRAETAYTNGWLDDALEDFIESEKKNKYDFTVHFSLALIYLKQNKIDLASDYFNKALKYAKPKSDYYSGMALLYLSLISYNKNNIEEAAKLSNSAFNTSPELIDAAYQSSCYYSLLNNSAKSIELLDKCVTSDVNYLLKACSDDRYSNIKQELNRFFIKKLEHYKGKFYSEYNNMNFTFNKIISTLNSTNTENLLSSEIGLTNIKNKIVKIEAKKSRNSVMDYYYITNEAAELNIKLAEIWKNLKTIVTNKISNLKSQIDSVNRNIKEKHENHSKAIEEKSGNTGGVVFFGLLTVVTGYGGIWMLRKGLNDGSLFELLISLVIFGFAAGFIGIAYENHKRNDKFKGKANPKLNSNDTSGLSQKKTDLRNDLDQLELLLAKL